MLSPAEELFIPSTAPLLSDSDDHELQVFWAFETARVVSSPDVCMLCLENVVVTPEGIAFLDSGECVLETIYPLDKNECLDRFPSLGQIWSEPGRIENLARTIETLDEAIFAREPGETGYFHWINSVLPRIAVLDRLPHLLKLPLLAYARDDFAFQSLAALGHQRSKLLGHGEPILVRRLWISTPCIFLGDHFTRPGFWSRELRRVLKVQSAQPPHRTLYVDRADANTRRVLNNSELREAVRDIGAEVVTLSGMAWLDQFRLFQETQICVSVHGAGLSNCIFMQSGGIIEIVPRSRPWPTYRTLAARCDLKYAAYITQHAPSAAKASDGSEDVIVEIDRFRRFAAVAYESISKNSLQETGPEVGAL